MHTFSKLIFDNYVFRQNRKLNTGVVGYDILMFIGLVNILKMECRVTFLLL